MEHYLRGLNYFGEYVRGLKKIAFHRKNAPCGYSIKINDFGPLADDNKYFHEKCMKIRQSILIVTNLSDGCFFEGNMLRDDEMHQIINEFGLKTTEDPVPLNRLIACKLHHY